MKKAFGKTLKDKRNEKNLTILELAALSEISESQIIRLEAGNVNKPRLGTLEAITSCLGLSLDSAKKAFGYI